MGKIWIDAAVRRFCWALAITALNAGNPGVAHEARAVSQTQDTNKAGLAAEIVECKRQDGILTIRMRIHNTADKDIDVFVIDNRNFHLYYGTAAAKKYLILEDSERTPLASRAGGNGSLGVKIPKGGSWVWWAKYPATPPDVKAVSCYTPLTPPFDGVPLTD
jgi:hypothetical protein